MPTSNLSAQLMAMSKEQKMAEGNPMGRSFGDRFQNNNNEMQNRDGANFNNKDDQSNLINVTKPNPYVIIKQKDGANPSGGPSGKDGDQKDGEDKQYEFIYPKSKIFVGGLDFKLTNDDLKQHFLKYGPIESAVILKDINTGQSRGFGFVTFKDEDVA